MIEVRPYTIAEMVEVEQDAGVVFGPYHRRWLQERAPERVQRELRLASERPYIQNAEQGFPAPLVNTGAAVASTATIASTTTETNLWDPSIHAPIPALDMSAGKVYTVKFGGIIQTTATPTAVFTMRVGTNNSAPPTGTTLGASATVTLGTIPASSPFYGQAEVVVRSIGVAASGATLTGNGAVWLPAAVAATATPHVVFGGTIASSFNHTVAQGISVSLIWSASSPSNTCTNQWVFGQSQN